MEWRPTARSDTFDVAVAAGLGALALASLALNGDPDVTGPSFADYARPGGWILMALCVAPLAVRRRFPLAVAVVVTAALGWLRIIEVPEFTASGITVTIALYSAAGYGRRHRATVLVLCAVALGALIVWDIARAADQVPDGKFVLATAFTAAVNVFQLGAALFLGRVVRTRRLREDELEAYATVLRDTGDAVARQAVLAERLRIARELHDVLAHHVSVIGVQAAAARRVLATKPDTAADLLGTIETASRDAVGETQRLLGLLRHDDDDADDDGIGPQPTLEAIPALAEQLRDAGVAVDVDLDGVDAVPSGIAVSAYRVVQEALTNTLRHAGPGTNAAVALRQRPSSLELVVSDDGAGTGDAGKGAGLGLVGMRERVVLHGGELKVGRRAGGGFEVRAWFPL